MIDNVSFYQLMVAVRRQMDDVEKITKIPLLKKGIMYTNIRTYVWLKL